MTVRDLILALAEYSGSLDQEVSIEELIRDENYVLIKKRSNICFRCFGHREKFEIKVESSDWTPYIPVI